MINDVKHVVKDSTDPEFYQCYELATTLPGPSQLQVELWDRDHLTADELIGETVIDLEDRAFNRKWQALGDALTTPTRFGPKPIEMRPMYTKTSYLPQATMKMWVDVMTQAEAAQYPIVNIAKPPPKPFELRLIIWRTKNVISMDRLTHMNDMYGKVWIKDGKPQETDIHWRAKKGRGSFNWRMKFDLELPMKFPYMHIQVWVVVSRVEWDGGGLMSCG